MNWFYVDGGQQSGPVTDEQLEELLRSGKITPDTLIWCEGMPDWQRYDQVNPIVGGQASSGQPAWPAAQTGPGAVCAQCGKLFNLDEMVRHGDDFICPNCKPIFASKLGAGAKFDTGKLNYAGFWIRFAAKFVDGLILGVVVFVPLVILILFFAFGAAASSNAGGSRQSVFSPGSNAEGMGLIVSSARLLIYVVTLGANIIFSTIFLGKYGATPGKMICRLKVVDAAGNKIGYGRAFGRSCAELLSRICYIGYIIAAFDGQKRALHDHICSTRVIHK